MKHLKLQTRDYEDLLADYTSWLSCLGYSRSMVVGSGNQVREYLHWLEVGGMLQVDEWSVGKAEAFMNYFKQRPNQRRGGGLSQSHINKQAYSLNLLFKYLHLTERIAKRYEVSYVEKDELKERRILSLEEVKRLYESCGTDVLGQRDRAMLSVYYGCGLRRSEGLRLELGDIYFEKSLLHVRPSKNGWDRYLPMALGVKQDLERYIYGGRQLLRGRGSGDRLFLTDKGKPLQGQTLMRRLKLLLGQSELPNEIGFHSLRHSIATHLLAGGMSLEEVSLFLGHRVLDSSQRYTHIKEKTWKKQ